MKLTLVRPYLSLNELPETDLPDFTVLTGLNGAGKTHLLKAIQKGDVAVDIAGNPSQDVRLFDWTNLTPQDESIMDVSVVRQEWTNLGQHLENLLSQTWGKKSVTDAAWSAGIRGVRAGDFRFLASSTNEELAKNFGITLDGQEILQIRNSLTQLTNNLNANTGDIRQRELLSQMLSETAKPIYLLTPDDFSRIRKPAWGQAGIFQQSFAKLFITYRELVQQNKLARVGREEGDDSVEPMTDEEFSEKYGSPPWDFVNRSLAAANLKFRINAPSLYNTAPYQAKLTKEGSSAEIKFSDLSSGERVLMSFAFAIYYASDARQSISRPKLLLLDEVDAPLHPSMCSSLLSTIEEVLVESYKLSVILTTHSPSTVALAPEGAIHVMRSGDPGVHKIPKDTALKDLTSGVPILSLSYDGRRQIFVESPIDVEVYQSCYNSIKSHIGSPIQPIFIATGVSTGNGNHVNTGCEVVRRVVKDLRAAGAQHSIGLLDWDGKNIEEDGIVVLAAKERDGLESVILDPLLLLNALLKHTQQNPIYKSLPPNCNYLELGSLDQRAIQPAIDEIQTRVLGRSPVNNRTVSYIGGINLLIDSEYLTMDDHALEAAVLSAFPEQKSISKRAGALMKWIAGMIIAERPEHTPMVLKDTLMRLISQ